MYVVPFEVSVSLESIKPLFSIAASISRSEIAITDGAPIMEAFNTMNTFVSVRTNQHALPESYGPKPEAHKMI